MNPFVIFITLLALSFAAWCQHIYTCFVEEAWLLLITGAIAAPIGIIHGVGVWFGAW